MKEIVNNLSSNVNNPEWRRCKVLELSSQGYTQSDIVKTLQVSQPSVNRNLFYLAKHAQEHLKTHIQHTLPLGYRRCMNGINQVLKQAWQVSQSSEVKKEERLAALSLANNCYKFILDLTTNGVVITDAIKFVQTNKEKLTMSSKEEDDGKEPKEPDYDEDKEQLEEKQEEEAGEQETTNQVF
jgi:predicted transcriptional regulator